MDADSRLTDRRPEDFKMWIKEWNRSAGFNAQVLKRVHEDK